LASLLILVPCRSGLQNSGAPATTQGASARNAAWPTSASLRSLRVNETHHLSDIAAG
jgi:hypothetical protein